MSEEMADYNVNKDQSISDKIVISFNDINKSFGANYVFSIKKDICDDKCIVITMNDTDTVFFSLNTWEVIRDMIDLEIEYKKERNK